MYVSKIYILKGGKNFLLRYYEEADFSSSSSSSRSSSVINKSPVNSRKNNTFLSKSKKWIK
ncbi:hypothetical protein CHS0354_042540 [Potamilus streckersoni]|uniref:Uncharacterized protein n=1 Tax=Potamilus streckersoni TaxID=2493646 RepID=A0AAE0TDT3_9BIVA|nr:hypothetical protein CHS0354_042540 [Potamilus streckersoni]